MAEIVVPEAKKGDNAIVVALAAGYNVREAAGRAGVSERTIWRRLTDPDFRQLVLNCRTAMLEAAVGMLADAATDAVTTLRELLRADSESVQLNAAKAILEVGPRLRESLEIELRLIALEAILNAQEQERRYGQWRG